MSSIKKNYLYNVIYEILIIVIPLITSPYISRTLGADSIGIYSYRFTIVSYFVLFARLGIVNFGSRSIASAKSKMEKNIVFSNTLCLQVMLACVMLIFYVMTIFVFDEDRMDISLVLVLYLVSAAFDINWFFFGIEKFKVTITRNIVIKILSTACIFLFIKSKDDLLLYAVILAISGVVGQILVFPYLRGEVSLVKPTISLMKNQFISIFVLFIPQIAVSLYKMMDKIMIGNYCPEAELGLYEYASMIVGIPLGFITSLGTIMLPRISSLMSKNEKEKSLEYTRTSLIFAFSLSVALAFGLAGIADTFIPFYLGEEFSGAVTLLKGLAFTVPFIAWANVVRTQYLIPSKKDKEYIISLFMGAAANIIINIILIPRYYAWGAVIGTIVAEGIVCIVQSFMARRYLSLVKYTIECSWFVLFGGIMYFCVIMIGKQGFNMVTKIITQVLIGILVYVIPSLFYTQNFLKIDVLSVLKKGR